MSRSLFVGLAVCTWLIAGCDDIDLGQPRKTSQKPAAEAKKTSTKTSNAKAKAAKPVPLEKAAIPRTPATPVSGDGAPSPFANWGGSKTQSEAQAIEQIGKTVRESLELGPTVVVWVIDRSESNAKLARSALAAIGGLYAADDFAAAAKDGKLLTAVVCYAEKTEFLLDPPSADSAGVKQALDAVKTEPGHREATFSALQAALEKYLPLRTKERREVLIAVITDEPGDDQTELDKVVAAAERAAIPIYVVGPSAPLGKVLSAVSITGPLVESEPDKRTHAADSYFSDWVSLDTGGNLGDTIDSGLGPWPLERLCHKSSGAYLVIGGVEGLPFNGWANAEAMSEYTPEYRSAEEMQKSLAENKCRQAVVDAAKLPQVKGALINPQLNFPKRNEAEMKRTLDKAQLDAARLEEGIHKLYDLLVAAEGDRAKLTGPRWQAAYDTALGRAAAAKVRIDGYNAMLAALKRGKSFEKESSSTWMLTASDSIETGSSYQKVADKAKTSLERVQSEHAGTPWAEAAEQELAKPLGWTWKEQ